MKRFDLVAEHPHYRDHLLPIWKALPDEIRGHDWGDGTRQPIPQDRTLLVAGYSEINRFPRNPVVYVEHGAGQSYVGLNPAVEPYYSGGPQHRNTICFVCPNFEVAERWNARYSDRTILVVGSPRLDAWHAGLRGQVEERTVAITFHWDAQFTGVPETASAFGHYREDVIRSVIKWRKEGWHVIGHSHPRYPALQQFWQTPEIREAGVEYVHESSEVLDRAAVLVADNTSMQAEFMSLGRGVVFLNHPNYRKDVAHGGRFWIWPNRSGCQIDTGTALQSLDLDTVPKSTWHPYAFADGRASQRVSSWLLSIA